MIIGFVNKTGDKLIAERFWDSIPRRGDIVCLADIPEPQVVVWVSWVEDAEDAPQAQPSVRIGIERQSNRGAHSGKKS